MKTARGWIPRLAIKFVILSAASASAPLAHAQTAAGVPWDWSHTHLVFSRPGTADEALRNDTYERWLTIANDPRYRIQVQKRSANATRSMPPNSSSSSDAVDLLRNALDSEIQQRGSDAAISPSFENSQSARTTTTKLPLGLTRARIPRIQRGGDDPIDRTLREPFADRMSSGRIQKDWSETLGNGGSVGSANTPPPIPLAAPAATTSSSSALALPVRLRRPASSLSITFTPVATAARRPSTGPITLPAPSPPRRSSRSTAGRSPSCKTAPARPASFY